MRTERLSAERECDLERAADLLREGRIVAFPTETVYGLGARADRPDAVAELHRVKRRPSGKRFAQLVASTRQAEELARFDERARALASAFWPGPLTLVLPDGKGGDVGLRCPDHPVTARLLESVGVPIAAPSANLSGEPAGTKAEDVLRSFGGQIAAVLDGGAVTIGESSTVVRLTGAEMEVLRVGAIREARLREALLQAGL